MCNRIIIIGLMCKLMIISSAAQVEHSMSDESPGTELNSTTDLRYPTLRVSTSIKAPWMMQTDTGYEGFLVDVINELSESSNFSYTLYTTINDQLTFLHGESVLTGVIGDIVSGRADIGLADLVISEERSQFVKFSTPFGTTGAHILIKKPDWKPRSIGLLLAPFCLELWILVVISLICAAAVYVVSRRFTSINDNSLEPQCQSSVAKCKQNLTMPVSLQDAEDLKISMASRTVLFCWWLFVAIAITVYTSNMTIYLLATSGSKPVIPFKSFGEMADQSDVKYGGWFGMVLNSNDEVQRKINRHIKSKHSYYSNLEEAVERILYEKNDYAAIVDGYNGQYITSKHCDLLLLQEQLLEINYGIACPKTYAGELLCESISMVITSLKEDGTLYRLMTKWWKSGSKCQDVSEDDYISRRVAGDVNFRSLTINDLGLAFIVLWTGIIVNCVQVYYTRKCTTKQFIKAGASHGFTADPKAFCKSSNGSYTTEITSIDGT